MKQRNPTFPLLNSKPRQYAGQGKVRGGRLFRNLVERLKDEVEIPEEFKK